MVATANPTDASTSKFAQAGNVRVHYNEAGAGPAVVMLHGGGPGATGWSNFQRNVGALSQKHRVLLVDQVGYGQTDYVPLTEAFSQVSSRTVRDLLDTLGIEKASLVGNSMGGGAALNFAIDYPERTEKLVLMGASGAGQSIFVPQPTEGIKVLQEVRRNPTLEGMRRLIQLMVYDASFLTDELLQQRLQAALATHRPETFDLPPPPPRELSHELAKVKAKTLIVWGRDDRVVAFDGCLRFLWGIPDAELRVFSKCGHWAQFEHAEDFNRLVEDLLGS